ncbi:IS701 family transposase [Flavilitoribacter nigricans]|uniref:Transposase IS701-like DDE domain-containing protein n=1 Tax=Flavilitoribacter nigricans (strain ATCC 23147 / DSM 23189 / NBRC 102662 / NCIMB 1420 / SS-2) TaxID=1122177 RepID=A0A2D0N115_FLAN2|nr:transposase [Flavilitoribacter nigricans]PHN02068.1 hypothetical protein CRP01_34105 [Flavilitoribacter nigricans DSM 23189 = NBRC 102662]
MITLPEEFSQQISAFAGLFSKKVFEHAKVLITGCLLVVGRRTVCSALRAVGLSQYKRFDKYHSVLSKAKWSCYRAARILLLLLVDHFSPAASYLVFGIDETIERRRGAKIKAKGIYRDPVRSSKSHFVKCSGLRWISLMLLTPISWADRVWALPFLTVLAPSERYHQQRGKAHKKITDWARQMMLQLSRWLPNRLIIIVADSSYSAIDLLDSVRRHVCMITRLRLDAALYDFVPPRPAGQVGRKRKKGERQPTLLQRLDDPETKWTEMVIPKWYNHGARSMCIASGTAIWYHSGMPPAPIRWVLTKDPGGNIDPAALLSTNLDLDSAQIIDFFIRRWTVEVTFEEVRAHLGVETQRQWSDLAIARSTPILMAMFTLITLWADHLQKQNRLVIKPCAWYQKSRPTFSDAIASVRYRVWRNQHFCTSIFQADMQKLNPPWAEHLIYMLTRAA